MELRCSRSTTTWAIAEVTGSCLNFKRADPGRHTQGGGYNRVYKWICTDACAALFHKSKQQMNDEAIVALASRLQRPLKNCENWEQYVFDGKGKVTIQA